MQYGFTGEFSQTLKEEMMPVLHKFVQKIEQVVKYPNFFYKTSFLILIHYKKEKGQYLSLT